MSPSDPPVAAPTSHVAVAGRLDCTLDAFERRCLNEIDHMQTLISPDNALIALLCDAVRMKREYVARVAAPTPETPSQWQPIATCPKDRSWFLGWNEDCGCFVWRDGPGLITGEDPAPTHWMPLPASPLAGAVSHPQPEVSK